MARDDFSKATRDALSKRVGLYCSNPSCRSNTVGPHSGSLRFVNIGVASHITAASPGGPRYDSNMTPIQRTSIDNAIWLCQSCAKLVDSDPLKYPVSLLISWRVGAETAADRALRGRDASGFYPQPDSALHIPIPRIQGLAYEDARARLMEAGWQPFLNHWSYENEAKITHGNELYFWEKGFHEIETCSGTGLAHCTFVFRDMYETELVVVTAGEVIPELDATALVWSWRVRILATGHPNSI